MKETGNVPTFGVRHVQVILVFVMQIIAVGMRVQLPVAIVAMTEKGTSPNPNVPTYDWNNKSIVLSSFSWGYVVFQVVAAELGRKYGCKPFLLVTMFISSSAMILAPLMADKLGSYGVMGCRAIMGLAQGFFHPSISNVLSRWSPTSERSRLHTLAMAGAPLGTVITMPIVGFISSSWVGWPFSFYLYGALGFVWMIFYFILGASSPSNHRGISEAEINFIESSFDSDGKKMKTPWKSILTSLPVWAIFFTQICTVWGYNTLLTQIPNYMNKMMHFNMKSNGLLSAAPYLTGFLLSFLFAFISDYVINENYLSRTWTRKIATAFSSVVPGMALITLSFIPDDLKAFSVVMLIVAVGFQSAGNSGYIVNNIDLAPNFAGLIMALCNGCANLVSIVGQVLVQFVVTDETDKAQWRIIFLTAAILYILPNVFYLKFASGEIQSWDSMAVEKGKKPQEKEEEWKEPQGKKEEDIFQIDNVNVIYK